MEYSTDKICTPSVNVDGNASLKEVVYQVSDSYCDDFFLAVVFKQLGIDIRKKTFGEEQTTCFHLDIVWSNGDIIRLMKRHLALNAGPIFPTGHL